MKPRNVRMAGVWVVAVSVWTGVGHATVIHIPADQPTIQAGLDAAASGDTVLVASGVYKEWLTWPALAVFTLQGEDPDNRAIVDPPFQKRALIYAPESEGSELIIRDMVFRNSHPSGPGSQHGGALNIVRSVVRIDNCLVLASGSQNLGGGVYFQDCTVEIAGSRISDCHSIGEGGGGYFDTCVLDIESTVVERNDTGAESYFTCDGLGLYLNDCTGRIADCDIRDHSNWYFLGAGIYSTGGVDVIGSVFERNEQWGSDYETGALHMGGACTIRDCTFRENYGVGAAITAYGDATITNNLFIANSGSFSNTGALLAGGTVSVSFCTFVDGAQAAIYLNGALPVIEHCLFTGNDQAIIDPWNNSMATCDYNVFFNNGSDYTGEEPGAHDQFGVDPLFVTGPDGDYYLSQAAAGQGSTSPCVDAGDPSTTIPDGTTRTDGVADAAPPDIGFHYPLTAEPTPTPTPVPPATPTPEPSPEPTPPGGILYTLIMPDVELQPGDRFELAICRFNYNTEFVCDEYLLLQIESEFWFWPSWTQSIDGDFAKTVPHRHSHDVILNFEWPDGGGHMSGIRFWAAILSPGTVDPITWDTVEWSF